MPMRHERLRIGGRDFDLYSGNTLVVGSGAAALNAALQLVRRGVRDVALVTERWAAGTSFNAGSDKQTYYKLALAGAGDDSPRRLAEDLFAGGCMDGDIALCEAQHSAQAFYDLVALGVPFPHDVYGGYVGYRTDNDPRGRATSAGPRTSRFMCECLGRAVRAAGVPIFDRHQAVALLPRDEASGRRVCGVLALDRTDGGAGAPRFVLFDVTNVILGVGGPGAMYRSTVYPPSQIGSSGLALRIGAVAQNLTESQYGLASIGFRWNLSGSYQQVVPRYLSSDPAGGDEHEFLNDAFADMRALAGAVFRKGYEWPFDCGKVAGSGSSLIDLLVHREIHERGRRVWLDYTTEASFEEPQEVFRPELLDDEARGYLEQSGATQGTPFARLRAMNPQAAAVYAEHGIDLGRDRLEIAVCAQHQNGGLRGSIWWESSVRHLFAVGEAAGTHGVRRPGGAALNAGQVGGIRAAMFIAHRYGNPPLDRKRFIECAGTRVAEVLGQVDRWHENARGGTGPLPGDVIREVGERMSRCAAHVRDPRLIERAVGDAWRLHARAAAAMRVPSGSALGPAFHALDLVLTHAVTLEAIRGYLERGGGSRGSFLVLDPAGRVVSRALGEGLRARDHSEHGFVDDQIQEIRLDDGLAVREEWRPVRPIPSVGQWFERVWADSTADRIVR